ncbi:MAG: glutathione S-transferase family protein, partial [SAR324 cluster bacterium]|nr:glutathione S-transferase family protein [SAR324 cluster bacterium]
RDENQERDPEFALASPMGKVPALSDGDVHMAESAAICLYLADRYSGGNLAPAVDNAARGRFLYWMMYTPAVVEPAMSEKFSGGKVNRFSNGWGDFDAMIETFEGGLGSGPWILGERFSAADVMLGSSAVFLRRFGLLPDSPVIEGYADRCEERPAYRKAESADEDSG